LALLILVVMPVTVSVTVLRLFRAGRAQADDFSSKFNSLPASG